MENLPVAQLKSLKTHFVHLGQRIEELNMVVHGHGNQSGPPWQEILARYNAVLQHTALISDALTTTVVPAGNATAQILANQAAIAQWPRPPHNALPQLVIHPSLPVPQGQPDAALGQLLQSSRSQLVVATDTEAIEPFKPSSEDPEVILNEMKALREEHDGRANRALRACIMLRDRYHWRARPDFAAEEEHQAQMKQQELEGREHDEEGDDEVEEQVVVDREQSEDVVLLDAPMGDADSDAPLADDDDLFEEVV